MIEIDSKTDELRRLLDERGVEHGDLESAPYPPYNSTRRMTTFWANKCVWQYIEDEREGGDIELVGRYMSTSVTPEQAITTALGSDSSDTVKRLMKLQGGNYSWPMLYEAVTGSPFDYDCSTSKSEEVFIEKLISIVGGRKVNE